MCHWLGIASYPKIFCQITKPSHISFSGFTELLMDLLNYNCILYTSVSQLWPNNDVNRNHTQGTYDTCAIQFRGCFML